jgi:hypothetical protein
MEPVVRIELTSPSYEDGVLPLNETGEHELERVRSLGPQLFPGWEDSTRPFRVSAISGFIRRLIAGPDVPMSTPLGNPRSSSCCLVCVAGFEPAASRFQGENSTGLSYTQPKLTIAQSDYRVRMLGRGRRMFMRRTITLAFPFCLAACSTTPKPCPPAQLPKVETIEVVRTVAKPCPVTQPIKPAPLAKPLPTKSDALIAVLVEKLAEYAGQGGYAERAEQAIASCKDVQ